MTDNEAEIDYLSRIVAMHPECVCDMREGDFSRRVRAPISGSYRREMTQHRTDFTFKPYTDIDWYALSNGLGTVMPDGTRVEPED